MHDERNSENTIKNGISIIEKNTWIRIEKPSDLQMIEKSLEYLDFPSAPLLPKTNPAAT
jgi:hypothetical protein